MLPLSPHASQCWAHFKNLNPGVEDSQCFDAFALGDTPLMAEQLAALILAGKKQATSSALWAYEASASPLPWVGAYSIVMDTSEQSLAIIQTVQVQVLPFHQVSAAFAVLEGEGDGSLAYWRAEHIDFFTRECKLAGRVFDENMQVVCEQFTLRARCLETGECLSEPGGR